MGILLILPILVAGYIYCTSSLYMKYKMHRYDGQLLYLLVGKFGVYFFSISSILTLTIFSFCRGLSVDFCSTHISLDYINSLKEVLVQSHIRDAGSADTAVFFLHASLISFILAYVFPSIYIWMVKKRHKLKTTDQAKYAVLQSVAKSGIESALINSIIHPGTVYMCSMSDRKVYVGTITSVSEPDEVNGLAEEFSLIPVYSGYRDKDSLSVKFNTFYKDVDPNNNVDFTIHLKKENIISMTVFDYEVFSKFKPKKEKHWILSLFGL